MDIFELKDKKKKAGLTNKEIADLSGIPFGTVHKIFSGATKNPRYSTLLAIEQVLDIKEKIPFTYDALKEEPMILREEAKPYKYAARTYSKEDIEQLEEVRAELINGYLYMLAAPNRRHQFILTNLLLQIGTHIQKNKGKCQIYPAPFDVNLFADDSTIVQPDLSIICNPDILTQQGCSGAPDWVIEIVSESNASYDYVTKLMQYQKAGVREYWIVDVANEKVCVYNFEDPKRTQEYALADEIPSGVIDNLTIYIPTNMC